MGDRRTPKQNDSLHLWLEMVAEELNNAGLDMKAVLKPEVDIPWTKGSAKDYLFRPVMKALTGKESTTELTTSEVSQVVDVINRHLAEKFGGLFIEFPSIEQLEKTDK